jgi:hypothetical protein
MSLEFDATYRDGAIYPDAPLGLPDNTPIHVTVAARPASAPPTSPRLTVAEFDALFRRHRFTAPPLPDDFSRSDIYSDHD